MKGYAENLKTQLTTEWAARTICYFDETDSTNQQAKLAAAKGAEQGTVFVADRQTAGRGRRGRSWESPSGVNIYFSLLLRPAYGPDVASMVTLVMGLAVAEAVREYCDVDALIKWPNDVVVKGRKVCGILTELGLQGRAIDHLIVGVGINVGRQEFAPEIAATDLEAETGRAVDRAGLLARILERFEALYEGFERCQNLSGLKVKYEALLVNRQREVRVLDPKGEYAGRACGISDTGELLVELPDGEIRQVYAGEVSVRGVYGYV